MDRFSLRTNSDSIIRDFVYQLVFPCLFAHDKRLPYMDHYFTLSLLTVSYVSTAYISGLLLHQW